MFLSESLLRQGCYCTGVALSEHECNIHFTILRATFVGPPVAARTLLAMNYSEWAWSEASFYHSTSHFSFSRKARNWVKPTPYFSLELRRKTLGVIAKMCTQNMHAHETLREPRLSKKNVAKTWPPSQCFNINFGNRSFLNDMSENIPNMLIFVSFK